MTSKFIEYILYFNCNFYLYQFVWNIFCPLQNCSTIELNLFNFNNSLLLCNVVWSNCISNWPFYRVCVCVCDTGSGGKILVELDEQIICDPPPLVTPWCSQYCTCCINHRRLTVTPLSFCLAACVTRVQSGHRSVQYAATHGTAARPPIGWALAEGVRSRGGTSVASHALSAIPAW